MRRASKAPRQHYTGPSGDTRFAWAGSQMTAEYNSTSGTILRRYVWGPGSDEPVVWYEGSGTGDRRWLHADERGSVVAVTDGSGNAIGINRYDEYGIFADHLHRWAENPCARSPMRT